MKNQKRTAVVSRKNKSRCTIDGGALQPIIQLAMQLEAGQLVRVTCSNVIGYPHDGIVSVAYGREYTAASAADVLEAVRVIHFCRGEPGGEDADELRVRETSLAWFVGMGKDAHIVVGAPPAFPPDVIVRRARARLGEGGYRVHRRNCKSFATDCYYGRAVLQAVINVGYGIAASLVLIAGAVVYAAHQFAHTPW